MRTPALLLVFSALGLACSKKTSDDIQVIVQPESEGAEDDEPDDPREGITAKRPKEEPAGRTASAEPQPSDGDETKADDDGKAEAPEDSKGDDGAATGSDEKAAGPADPAPAGGGNTPGTVEDQPAPPKVEGETPPQ